MTAPNGGDERARARETAPRPEVRGFPDSDTGLIPILMGNANMRWLPPFKLYIWRPHISWLFWPLPWCS